MSPSGEGVGNTGGMVTAEPPAATSGPPLRMLCVEDNYELARYLHLEFHGEVVVPGRSTEVTLAEDLAGAREQLTSQHFDLVLLDLALPDSQGMDTLLGVVELAPASPVVIITGKTDVDFGERALLAGAHDFLVKGRYTSADLRRCVRFAVARQRRMAESQAASTAEAELDESSQGALRLRTGAQAVAPHPSRRVPLQEMFPEPFAELVSTYARLVPLRLEEQGLHVDYQVSSSSRVLAGELGRLRARAHDLAEVHLAALQMLSRDTSKPRSRALGVSADSLLLETLGHLVSYYRNQAFGLRAETARERQGS